MKKIINKILDNIALTITKYTGVMFLYSFILVVLSAIYFWAFIIVRCFGIPRIYCHSAGALSLLTIFICIWAYVRVLKRKEHNEKG